jgi:hypothetical protein
LPKALSFIKQQKRFLRERSVSGRPLHLKYSIWYSVAGYIMFTTIMMPCSMERSMFLRQRSVSKHYLCRCFHAKCTSSCDGRTAL